MTASGADDFSSAICPQLPVNRSRTTHLRRVMQSKAEQAGRPRCETDSHKVLPHPQQLAPLTSTTECLLPRTHGVSTEKDTTASARPARTHMQCPAKPPWCCLQNNHYQKQRHYAKHPAAPEMPSTPRNAVTVSASRPYSQRGSSSPFLTQESFQLCVKSSRMII